MTKTVTVVKIVVAVAVKFLLVYLESTRISYQKMIMCYIQVCWSPDSGYKWDYSFMVFEGSSTWHYEIHYGGTALVTFIALKCNVM